MKISAVIITLNEEKNIARCLDSLQNIADEILVIDSGSTDQTQSICQQKNVKFIYQKWLGYAQQKNFGNSLAQHDWILSLDADEALSQELQKSILSLKSTNQNPDYAYLMARLTNYCGHWVKYCGWYPDKKIRLWNRLNGSWKGEIHEDLDLNVPTKSLKGDILHYSYYNIAQHIAQMNHFTQLMAADAVAKGKKANLFKIIFSPFVKFIKSYFIQLGFLDGYYGLVICLISAHATFIKYIKIRELNP